MGKYPEALKYDLKALAIQEEMLGTKHPSTAASYNNIGIVYDNMGDNENAIAYYRQALDIYEALGDTSGADKVRESVERLGKTKMP
jgi:tetratricopeptide (TPR) repeat protein